MEKRLKASSRGSAGLSRGADQTVLDRRTGQTVTVRGVGALEESGLKIKSDVDLLKPIAGQIFSRRSKKRDSA